MVPDVVLRRHQQVRTGGGRGAVRQRLSARVRDQLLGRDGRHCRGLA